MRVLRRVIVGCSTFLLLVSGLSVASATTAFAATDPPADTVTGPLSISSVDAFALDAAHGHLLIGSWSQNGLLVANLDGTPVTTLLTKGIVTDVVVSPDPNVAYAASAGLQTIFRIDLTTLAVTGSWLTPSMNCPHTLAPVSATLLAFGDACFGQFGGVSVLNMETGVVNESPTGTQIYTPTVRTVPGTWDVIVTETGLSAAGATEYDVFTGSPVKVHDTDGFSYGLFGCGYLHSAVSVSPEGGSFTADCGGGPVTEFSVADFRPVATYLTERPIDTAISPNGSLLAVAGYAPPTTLTLFHHTAKDTSQMWTTTVPQTAGDEVNADSLTFSPDGSTLYFLTFSFGSGATYLHRVPMPATPAGDPLVAPAPVTHAPPVFSVPVETPTSPAPPANSAPPMAGPPADPTPVIKRVSKITVAISKRPTLGRPITVSGVLHIAGVSHPKGTRVTVTFSVGGITSTGHTTANRLGRYTFTFSAPRPGRLSVSAAYAGSQMALGSKATRHVMVGARTKP